MIVPFLLIWLSASAAFPQMTKSIDLLTILPQARPRQTDEKAITGTIRLDTFVLDTGAINATIDVIDTDAEILIMVTPINSNIVCNPNMAKLDYLDMHDSVLHNRVMTGTWTVSAQKDTNRKIYSAIIAAPSVRQQFGTSGATAVSGGAVYGLLHVCLFKSTNDKNIELLDEKTTSFRCTDGPVPTHMDLTANILKVGGNDQHITFLMETRISNYLERKTALMNNYLNVQIENPSVSCDENKISTITPFDSMICSMPGITRRRGLYWQECTQRWIVSVMSNTADVIVKFDAKDRIRQPVPFVVHAIVHSPNEQNRARKLQRSLTGEDAPVVVVAHVLVNGTKHEISTNIARRSDTVINQEIKVIDGNLACILLSVNSDIAQIMIMSAYLEVCKQTTCYNLTMVKNGVLDNTFARHAAGTMEVDKDGVTKLCYTPVYSISGKIYISWKTVDKSDVDITPPRFQQLKHIPMMYPRDEWCVIMEIPCNGTYIIQPSIVCAPGEAFDPVLGECVSHSQLDLAGGVAIFFFVILGLVLVGGIVMVALYSRGW